MTAVVGRRELLAAFSGAVAWPLTVRAQQPTSLHVGIVTIQPRTAPVYAAFDQRLRELGHIEGQNLVTDYLNPERQAEGEPGAIKELIRRKVDIIVAPYESTVKAAIAASDTVPVVMIGIDWDPVALGYIKTLARPGGDAVAGLVGIEGGVVSGVFNLESSGVEAPDWRPRHDEHYHEA